MQSEVIFEEIQGSGKTQLRDFLRALSIIFFLALCLGLYLNKLNFNLMSVILINGVVIAFIASLLSYSRMITQIRTDGIYIRFPPFQSSFIAYRWENILDVYLRNYDALSEYGGWGIKFTAMGIGYVLPGTWGIQMVLKDKTRVLISTKMPAEVSQVLQQLGKI
ncbi:MAG: hypothetical protein ACJ749_02975 [Flavisolibacter sp.]